MPIFTEERCQHCHKLAEIALDYVPVPLSKFAFECPTCHERSVFRFTFYKPTVEFANAVRGYPPTSRIAVAPALST